MSKKRFQNLTHKPQNPAISNRNNTKQAKHKTVMTIAVCHVKHLAESRACFDPPLCLINGLSLVDDRLSVLFADYCALMLFPIPSSLIQRTESDEYLHFV